MASEFAPEDFISRIPDNVVTSILHRLPLRDAVRTGILSRNWRFKWTMLSHLKFDEDFLVYLMKTKGENYCFMNIISRFLLHINGAVTKSEAILGVLDVEDVHHLIFFLSRKGIKDLILTDWCQPLRKLPSHIFSCLELKHLNIIGCGFHPPPGFHGFPNLLSLELRAVQLGNSDLGEFLTRCPLLENLNLGYLCYPASMKLVEIAKLKNLKVLSFSLCHLDSTTIVCPCNVFELVGYLPKLQELGLDFQSCRLTEPAAIKKFPTTCPSIKTLKLTTLDFGNGTMLSCALEMIRHFPNLQTLDITASRHVNDPTLIVIPMPIPEVECDMMKLWSVAFRYMKDTENEVILIKYFLACSPFLKNFVIQREWCLAPDGQLTYAKKLLKLHRASPVAEIDFK